MTKSVRGANLPDFLVIGAARSGTSTLYHYLRQHPRIYVPNTKEQDYFAAGNEAMCFKGPGDDLLNRRAITNLSDYLAVFKDAKDEDLIGEVSPWYLYSREGPRRIYELLPKVTIIAVLRNPVERAYSHYLLMRKMEREPCKTFGEALAEESERVERNWAFGWHYKRLGFYFEQLKRYYEVFDSGQIHVLLYDDLKDDEDAFFVRLCNILNVDTRLRSEKGRKIYSGATPRSERLQRFLTEESVAKTTLRHFVPSRFRRCLGDFFRSRNVRKPPLEVDTRSELLEAYSADLEKLQSLLGRDLAAWRV